jgi:hypothetical protein
MKTVIRLLVAMFSVIAIPDSSLAALSLTSVSHISFTCQGDTIAYSGGTITITGASCTFPQIPFYYWGGPSAYSQSGFGKDTMVNLVDPGEYYVTYSCNGTPSGDTLRVSVGYEVDYTDFAGTQEVLTSKGIGMKNTSGSNNWCRGASSKNYIPASEDCWVEIVADVTNKHRKIGFSDYGLQNHCANSMDYGVYLVSGGNLQRVVGSSYTNIGTYAAGNRIRVAREGTNLKIYKNGTLINTYAGGTTLQNKELVGDFNAFDANYVVDNVGCSHRGPFPIDIEVNHIPCGASTGGISISPCADDTYTYSWSGGESTSTISGKSVGLYTATITTADGWAIKRSISVGYEPTFVNAKNSIINAQNLLKNAGSASWDAGANSKNSTNATNQWIEFEINSKDKQHAFGFNNSPANSHPLTSQEYGVILYNDSTRLLHTSSTTIGSKTTVKNTDIVRVKLETSTWKVFINEYLTGSGSMTGSTWYGEVLGYDIGSEFQNVRVSWNCDTIPQGYSELEYSPNGGVVVVFQERVKFVYPEVYDPGNNAKLEYRVYNYAHQIVAGIDESGTAIVTNSPLVGLDYGINKYSLNLEPLSLAQGFYLLEVVTPKDEKLYLKFEIL